MKLFVFIVFAFIVGAVCSMRVGRQGIQQNGFSSSGKMSTHAKLNNAEKIPAFSIPDSPRKMSNEDSTNPRTNANWLSGFEKPKISKNSIERTTRTMFAEQKTEVEDLLEGTKDTNVKQAYGSKDEIKFNNNEELQQNQMKNDAEIEEKGNSEFEAIKQKMMEDAESRRMQFGINGKQNKLKFNKDDATKSFTLEDDFSEGFSGDDETKEFLPKGEWTRQQKPHRKHHNHNHHYNQKHHKKPIMDKLLSFIGFNSDEQEEKSENNNDNKLFGKSLEKLIELTSKLAQQNPELAQTLLKEAISIGSEIKNFKQNALNSMESHWKSALETLTNACSASMAADSSTSTSNNAESTDPIVDCLKLQNVRSEWNAKKGELQFKCVDSHDQDCEKCLRSKAQSVKHSKHGIN